MKNKEVLRKKYPGVPQEELVPFDKFNIFVDHGKYYTLDNKNKPVVLSNFILEPIAQIRNEELNESSYMYWIKNTQKERQLICLKAENLCRNNSFAALLLNHGYFVWKGTDRNLSNLFERLNEKIERCLEFNTLFWQEKYRVWAWGNGISTINGEFIPASETGIVHFNGKSFFIRACSNLIKDESSKLKNERHLNFSDKNPISTLDWSRLLLEAYGKKSLAGICFVLMSIFSDFLFAEERALPVLNLIGKPGSGKNEFAGSIISVLYNTSDLKPLSLANKTVSSLSDRLMLYRNGIAFLDEFRNVKEDELLLKDIYNRTPRSRSDMPGLKNPEIYATALVAGEHYPEQEALVTRIIPIKSEDTSWSESQTEAFNKLKQMENGKWKVLLTTDISLSFIKMVEIYQTRWTIEVFFKESKQLLRMGSCQSNDFDAQIADTTITMLQHLLLTLRYRYGTYESTGALFEQVKETTAMLKLNERLWGLFVEILQILECLFEVEDEMTILERIINNDHALTQIKKLFELGVDMDNAA